MAFVDTSFRAVSVGYTRPTGQSPAAVDDTQPAKNSSACSVQRHKHPAKPGLGLWKHLHKPEPIMENLEKKGDTFDVDELTT